MHHRDGWEALGALLPPPERRGLVLIDPPYEAPDEFDRLAAGLACRPRANFPPGCYAAWYPIKHRAPVRAFHDATARERPARRRRRRTSAARAARPGAAERQRAAGGQPALAVRGGGARRSWPRCWTGSATASRARARRCCGSPMSSVAVVGAGAWGTALAVQASRAGCAVTLWARDPARAAEMARSRDNPRLPGVALPDEHRGRRCAARPTPRRSCWLPPLQHLRACSRRLPPRRGAAGGLRQGHRGGHAAPAAGDRRRAASRRGRRRS